MPSIFYDIETTDLARCGQLLNFAFVAVDDEFEPIETFAANVRISRLQLPRIDAILANRTNVIEHQKTAELTEREAVYKIKEFFDRIARSGAGKTVSLIGYSSSGFDLDFLRTIFIRNGVNPYNKQIVPKDLLLVSRQLMAHDEGFRAANFEYAGERKVNLKLETLCKLFGLLDGVQEHESLSDVLLTVKLAKKFQDEFGIDVREFAPYQVQELHNAPRGTPHYLCEPLKSNFKPETPFRDYPAVLLDRNERYALWIDLVKYEELKKNAKPTREAIRYRKFAADIVFRHKEQLARDYSEVIQAALEEHREIKLSNYFTPTDCDIEAFIYRISPSQIDLLGNAMRTGVLPKHSSSDMIHLYRRYWLENHEGGESEEFQTAIARYAAYRYGGRMKLGTKKDGTSEFHPTYQELLREIKDAEAEAKDEDRELISALKNFYAESKIHAYLEERRFL